MSLPIAFRPVAQAEYEAAAAWYEVQQPGLGSAFEVEIEAVLNVIAGRPDRYPVATRDIREAAVARFPYCVYYRVRTGRVVIVAVFHQSRDPAEWQSRG